MSRGTDLSRFHIAERTGDYENEIYVWCNGCYAHNIKNAYIYPSTNNLRDILESAYAHKCVKE